MRSNFALCAMAFLTGCSSLPEDAKVVAFGAAVDNGIAVIRQAGNENANIALLWDKEFQAGQYICGEEWSSVSKPSSSIAPSAIEFRIRRLEALAAYASALKTASDKSGIDKLADASSNLIVTASGLASTVVPDAAPLVAPIAKIAGKAAGLAIQDHYARQVNEIIVATDPYVQRIVPRLVSDMSNVEVASTKTLRDYKIVRDVNLDNMRIKEIVEKRGSAPARYRCRGAVPAGSDVEVIYDDSQDRGLAHDRLISGIDQEISAEAAIKAANKSGSLLLKIASTHRALAEKESNADADIRALVSLTEAVAELVSAGKKGT